MGVHRKGDLCQFAGSRQDFANGRCGERRLALTDEYVGRIGIVTLEPAQGAYLHIQQPVTRGDAVFEPPDLQQALFEVDLRPFERHRLGHAQTVAKHQ